MNSRMTAITLVVITNLAITVPFAHWFFGTSWLKALIFSLNLPILYLITAAVVDTLLWNIWRRLWTL